MRHWKHGLRKALPLITIKIFTLPMRHWKPFIGFFKVKSFNIFTLPMRHWKFRLFTMFFNGSAFLLYLWGIEKRLSYSHLYQMLIFLLYLWGIEKGHLLYSCLQCLLFLLYLWGIEKAFSYYAHAFFSHFYSTYEALKNSILYRF